MVLGVELDIVAAAVAIPCLPLLLLLLVALPALRAGGPRRAAASPPRAPR